MKKILAFGLVALSFSTSAFATALNTNTLPGNAGVAIYGGTIDTEAQNATNPLVRLSTGVWGVVNFTASANKSTSYAIATKHEKGSKIFGTANDSTNIYWKASPAVSTAPYMDVNAVGAGVDNTNFGAGWTAY